MLITSLENEKIKNMMRLKEKKYRDQTDCFLVEGEHLVLEAYRAGIIDELILEQDSVFPIQIDSILYVTNPILKKLSDLENPSYVMALCHKKNISNELGKKILMLDGVQDPGNLGTILRSSKAFDVDTVILSTDTVDLYNPKVIRATQGMMFHLNIIRCDLIPKIEQLKAEEFPIYVTRVQYGEDVRLLKEKDKKQYVLIMGNEGRGVKEEILDLADHFLYIDMNHMVDSLNVAIATSILLYELKVKNDG